MRPVSSSVRSAVAIVTMAVTALASSPTSVSAVTPTCFGRAATIVGTSAGEILNGTAGDDVIVGLGGDDEIHGKGGVDRICGGPGADSLHADKSTARVSGGNGADRLYGGRHRDILLGGSGDDQLFGVGNADRLDGGLGDDALDGGPGDDRLAGGDGFDVVLYLGAQAGISASLTAGSATGDGIDTLAGFEGIFGSPFGDHLTGDAGDINVLIGTAGNDVLSGGDGADENCASSDCFDYLAGGDGDDSLRGGPGVDFASFTDSLFPVIVSLQTGTASGQGADTLQAIEGIDGSNGPDTMAGDSAANYFVGEGGDDSIDGSAAPGGDAAFYLFATGGVTVDLAAGTATGADGNDQLIGISSLAGSIHADVLRGDASTNVLLGEESDDTLNGRGGVDSLDGGPGDDTCRNGEVTSGCETLVASSTRSTTPREVGSLARALSRVPVLSRLRSKGSSAAPQVTPHAVADGHPNVAMVRGTQPAAIPPPSPLTYRNTNAPVAQTSRTFAIFWVPSGWYQHPNYQSLMYRYFADVGGSTLYNTMTQYYLTYYGYRYYIYNSSTWGGYYVDTTPYPANRCTNPVTGAKCLLDPDIRAAITRAVTQKGWSGGTANMYFVYTAYGEGSCFAAGCASASYRDWCAYHYAFANAGAWYVYANMPYQNSSNNASQLCRGVPAAPNGNKDLDAALSMTSHEHFEMVTDPYGGVYSPDIYAAWQGAQGLQDENADKCAWSFGTLAYNGGTANQRWNGHFYVLQTEFSNEAYFQGRGWDNRPGCVQGR